MASGRILTEDDLHYFNEGRFFQMHEKLGARVVKGGVHFAVWAPSATAVSVVGDFNGWEKEKNRMRPLGNSGIWVGFAPGAGKGQCYKYHVRLRDGRVLEKSDPMALCMETPPATASVIWQHEYQWNDEQWMKRRGCIQAHDRPMSIYEMHLGSWRRNYANDGRPFSYRSLADILVPYIQETGFTHVQFMPVMEHPFGGSWGYHVTGYFSPTRRYGDPEDLMYLVDRLHQAEIGVIFDWVPAHFPDDPHGLAAFDGTCLYEHEDVRQGLHPQWNSLIFNYGRHEVRSFLVSSALFWLEKFHADGLRVDAVSSMLYLDYARKDGEWIPNRHGGRENLEAIHFLRELNEAVYARFPDVHMIAEESTSWPLVTRQPYTGGLGFSLKWDLGWMNDTLDYFERDPIHRQFHHNNITFRSLYAFHENFVMCLSHDEVVHGRRSIIGKMPGDDWQKFANLRCLYSYMYAQPGKKLMFMGAELAQWREWNHDAELDWHLLGQDRHRQIKNLVSDLNRIYRSESALHLDCCSQGFEWIDGTDSRQGVISFLRKAGQDKLKILCIFNFTPVLRTGYEIGVPEKGLWREIFNSDAKFYGGSGCGNLGGEMAQQGERHGRPFFLALAIPPLSGMFFKWES